MARVEDSQYLNVTELEEVELGNIASPDPRPVEPRVSEHEICLSTENLSILQKLRKNYPEFTVTFIIGHATAQISATFYDRLHLWLQIVLYLVLLLSILCWYLFRNCRRL